MVNPQSFDGRYSPSNQENRLSRSSGAGKSDPSAAKVKGRELHLDLSHVLNPSNRSPSPLSEHTFSRAVDDLRKLGPGEHLRNKGDSLNQVFRCESPLTTPQTAESPSEASPSTPAITAVKLIAKPTDDSAAAANSIACYRISDLMGFDCVPQTASIPTFHYSNRQESTEDVNTFTLDSNKEFVAEEKIRCSEFEVTEVITGSKKELYFTDDSGFTYTLKQSVDDSSVYTVHSPLLNKYVLKPLVELNDGHGNSFFVPSSLVKPHLPESQGTGKILYNEKNQPFIIPADCCLYKTASDDDETSSVSSDDASSDFFEEISGDTDDDEASVAAPAKENRYQFVMKTTSEGQNFIVEQDKETGAYRLNTDESLKDQKNGALFQVSQVAISKNQKQMLLNAFPIKKEEESEKQFIEKNGKRFYIEDDTLVSYTDDTRPAIVQEQILNPYLGGEPPNELDIRQTTEGVAAFFERINPESFIRAFIATIVFRPQDGKVARLSESNYLFPENEEGTLDVVMIDADATFPTNNTFSDDPDWITRENPITGEITQEEDIHVVRNGLMAFPQAERPLSDKEKRQVAGLIDTVSAYQKEAVDIFRHEHLKHPLKPEEAKKVQKSIIALKDLISRLAKAKDLLSSSSCSLQDIFFHIFPEYEEEWNDPRLAEMSRPDKALNIGQQSMKEMISLVNRGRAPPPRT